MHEHIEARWATARMIAQLSAMGNWAANSSSDAATASAVLTQQRDRARAHNPHFVISNHLNGFSNASARGVEVLYRDDAMLPLARALCATIARELGIPNRGPRRRTDLFFLNSFPRSGILIEWAFMTNAADMQAWSARRAQAVDAAARTIAINTGGHTSALPATPVPNPLPTVPTPETAAASGDFGITIIAATRFRVATAGLNVRSEPSTRGRIVRSLARDLVITVTRRARTGEMVNGNRNWWWTGEGWVSGAHLSVNAEQFRTTARANFRASPNGSVIRTLNVNTTVTAISSSSTIQNAGGHRWRNVAVAGQRGWIATSLLRAV
jgi:hypothetical protein